MKNKKIAVFANGWSNEYLEQVLEGLREEAKKEGVDIFVFLTYSSWGDSFQMCKSQMNIFHLPNPKDFDGAIMFTNSFNFPDEEERVCALFKNRGIPLISTGIKVEGLPYIGVSNYEGVYELACHLVEKHNVEDVVYVSGLQGSAENTERKQALVDALNKYGLKLLDTIDGDFSFYGGYHGAEKWIERNQKLPDAFVCANDHLAIGVCNILHDLGYSVPEDAIVTGYDNILQARTGFPMIATVGTRWSEMGHELYKELKKQFAIPDPNAELRLNSVFIPSESCGCKPTKEQITFRLNKHKTAYYDKAYNDLKEMFYQNMRFGLAKVENTEEFYEQASELFKELSAIGQDYSICIEPEFLNLNDEKYHRRRRGYSHNMTVVYHEENGKTVRPFEFDSDEIVPRYSKGDDESNIYFVVPLCNMEYTIGYAVVKNKADMIYDLSFRNWVMNMNSLFVNFRQYIFAQESNRKLKEIYMRDFLTGMYNRTGCENVLYEKIQKNRNKKKGSILLFADINRMKIINDKYGHLNGDIAIKATADALRYALAGEWLFGRYGGDEFIAVGDLREEMNHEKFCKMIETRMQEYVDTLNLSFDLSASVGFAVIESYSEGVIEEYIRRADESMYEAKQEAHRRIDAKLDIQEA